MYQTTGEDVMSDEERSIESEDLQKDEISDLFDHSAEDQEDSSRENPSDLTHAPALGVPYLRLILLAIVFTLIEAGLLGGLSNTSVSN
jgi:hypothetical protein